MKYFRKIIKYYSYMDFKYIRLILIALLSGVVAKLYDDLEDNDRLESFKNPTLLECLKIIEIITLTFLGIEEPMFFITCYFIVLSHFIVDNSCYNNSYEYSLVIIFPIMFLLMDYTKIKLLSFTETFFLVLMAFGVCLEPYITTSHISEYSLTKLIIRSLGILFFVIIFFICKSIPITIICVYSIGYTLTSALVQIYSLYIYKDPVVIFESDIRN